MPTTSRSNRDLPLPVRIFEAAMEQQLSLDAYAQRLGISSESLRAVVTARPSQDDAAVLDHLADVYKQPRETLRDQLAVAPAHESFAAWLKRNMEGISQQALRARVQVDSKTLKQFLNGETLPDSDQAERISRALYIDRTEVARVVIANVVDQADAERQSATATTSAEPATGRPRRTRRQDATSGADPASAEGAAPTGAGVVEPAAERPPRPARRRQAGGTPAAPAPSEPAVAAAIDPPDESEAPGIERPRRPRARRPKDTPAGVAATARAGESTPGAAPEPQVEPPRQRAARRRASTTAAASDATATSPAGPIGQQDKPTVDATASPTTSTTAVLEPAPAPVTSVPAAETTTLQLTADEVRLIRHWRRLHPHGRRATLHYIGSLLVDD